MEGWEMGRKGRDGQVGQEVWILHEDSCSFHFSIPWNSKKQEGTFRKIKIWLEKSFLFNPSDTSGEWVTCFHPFECPIKFSQQPRTSTMNFIKWIFFKQTQKSVLLGNKSLLWWNPLWIEVLMKFFPVHCGKSIQTGELFWIQSVHFRVRKISTERW